MLITVRTLSLLLASTLAAQTTDDTGWKARLSGPYQAPVIPPARRTDTQRLERLVRGGNLYLSLQDAIALALENNLDVALQRLSPLIADADLRRAEAGSVLRGVPLTVRRGPEGVGGPVGQVQQISSSVTTTPLSGASQDSSLGPNTTLTTGPLPPGYDPVLTGQVSWNHTTTPQSVSFLAGTDALIARQGAANVGVQQGFSTGAQLDANFDNNRTRQNNRRLDINPTNNSSLGLTFTQPLLRGFGTGLNRRFIRIARNNRQVTDLLFREQLLDTVATVIRLYWDLATFTEDIRVRQQTLTLAERLLADNRVQVSEGTLPPLELARGEAEVARARRDLTSSQSLMRQQETILKDYLTRGTIDSPVLAGVRIIPTDPLRAESSVPVRPLQDLAELALQKRPDLAQSRLQIENSRISLTGSRNALLPAIDVYATTRHNGLAGPPNSLGTVGGSTTPGLVSTGPSPGLTGGYGDALSQLFRRNYPDYGVGVQLSVPLRNRAAQADVVRDQLEIQRQEFRLQQLQKQVRVEIQNALTTLEQARAALEAAASERVLQQRVLDAEQERYGVGATTNYLLIQAQRDLASARSAEVIAQGSVLKAGTALDRALGTLLDTHDISLQEALEGAISRPSAVPPPPAAGTP